MCQNTFLCFWLVHPLLLLGPIINLSPCGNNCCNSFWDFWGCCMFAFHFLGLVREGHLWSYSLPFSIYHLFSLCLCYVQKFLVWGEGCKIPANQFISSVSAGAPEGFLPCGTLPTASGGHFAAKSFQLFHNTLKHWPCFPLLLPQYFIFGCSLHHSRGAYTFVFSTVIIFHNTLCKMWVPSALNSHCHFFLTYFFFLIVLL